jgi:hypothetical protein
LGNTSNDKCHSTSKRRAPASGISLSDREAAIVKGMLARGDRAHDVASWFGVNSGKIAEIATGGRFANVPASPAEELPPPGPYVPLCDAARIQQAIDAAQAALDMARDVLARRSH